MYAQFKLGAGSPRRDTQDPIEISVIVGPAGAHQARKPSQCGLHSVVFDAAKSQKTMELDVQHKPQKPTTPASLREKVTDGGTSEIPAVAKKNWEHYLHRYPAHEKGRVCLPTEGIDGNTSRLLSGRLVLRAS